MKQTRRVLLTVLAVATLAAVVASGAGHAEVAPRAVIVAPFDASGLAPDDQWMGDGIAQLISLGLAQHPAFVQIARSRLATVIGANASAEVPMSQAARDVHAVAVLYGRIDRRDGQLVLQPILLDVQRVHTMWLLPMTMADVDLVTHGASLPAVYAHALQVTLTDGEKARMWKAAQPTRSLQALELFTRGQMAFADGDNNRAIALILRSVEIDPHFVIAQYTLGGVHLVLKNRWKAAGQFRLCTQLDPSMPEPYKALGDLSLEAPRALVDQAIEIYSRAITLRPFYTDAHVGLGDARAAKGDVDGALAAYQQAVAFDPLNPRTHLRLGTIYRNRARCVDAVNAFKRALALGPRSEEARNSVAAVSETSCK